MAIESVTIEGFKAFRDRTTLKIRPLTLLAGANSSGKSSAMQPLLLIKQTLEAQYDPGPLLLSGPNVALTSMTQCLWRGVDPLGRASTFSVGFELGDGLRFKPTFQSAERNTPVQIRAMSIVTRGKEHWIEPGMGTNVLMEMFDWLRTELPFPMTAIGLRQERCFLELVLVTEKFGLVGFPLVPPEALPDIIHIPGLRGNPLRQYPTTQVGKRFPGTFQDYTASIVLHWQESRSGKLFVLGNQLQRLGLSWKIEAVPLSAVGVELKVGRLPNRPEHVENDLVNIADVGFGVSQILPVLVALLVAQPDQLVIIEQPELHLHPLAQARLAPIIIEAAKGGVRLVIETHSLTLLTALQAEVARGHLDPDHTALHWFSRDEEGACSVKSVTMGRDGSTGDWPVDFADIEMAIEGEYIDAAIAAGESG